jgi:glycosyltransferase involved in cell wall biosynthesis
MSDDSRNPLQDICAAHQGKTLDKWALYLREYERLLAPYRDQRIRLLEIGVQNGGSLEIWAKYFPNADLILGCDIDPACATLRFEDPRIRVVIGDATTDEAEHALAASSPHYDVIIDDGSHRSSDIIAAFARYFPRLSRGGTYIVEDLHASYWGEYQGGLYHPYSSMTFFKRIADAINEEHWGVPRSRGEPLKGILAKHAARLDEAALAQVHSIEFVNSLCIIKKDERHANELGARFVAGSQAAVEPRSTGAACTSIQHSQATNPWTTRALPPDEEIEELTVTHQSTVEQARAQAQQLAERARHVAALEAEAASLHERCRASEEQVTQLRLALARDRASASWRVTAPLRLLGGALPGAATTVRDGLELARWLSRFRAIEGMRLVKRLRLVRASGLFDASYYLSTYPDVLASDIDPLLHFVRHGGAERRNPNARFNTERYLESHPDAGRSGMNPFVHYLMNRKATGTPGGENVPAIAAPHRAASPAEPPVKGDRAGGDPRIVLLSMMKNEADIVEHFVRHNAPLFDATYIIDNGSDDNTVEILEQLRAEGFNLHIWSDSEPGYSQSEKMKQAYLRLQREDPFDFLAIVDADEFIMAGSQESFRRAFTDRRTKHFLEWVNYVPIGDQPPAIPLPERIAHHVPFRTMRKVVLPSLEEAEHRLRIWQGNHNFEYIGLNFGLCILPFPLAHFPVRSREQMISKASVGWLAYQLKTPHARYSIEGYQWRAVYDLLLERDLTADDLTTIAYHYCALDKLRFDVPVDRSGLVHAPARLRSTEQRYPRRVNSPHMALLRFSEQIIQNYWNAKAQVPGSAPTSRSTLQKLRSKAAKFVAIARWEGPRAAIGKTRRWLASRAAAANAAKGETNERRDPLSVVRDFPDTLRDFERHTYLPGRPHGDRKTILFLSHANNLRWQTLRYRSFNVIEGLARFGWSGSVVLKEELGKAMPSILADPPSILVVVRLERSDELEDLMRRLKTLGTVVVADIDDLVFDEFHFIEKLSKPAAHISELYDSEWAQTYRNQAKRHLKTLQLADFTTAPTRFLADEQSRRGCRAFVIPNSLNRAQMQRAGETVSARDDHIVRVGYFSGSPTHNHDFELVTEQLYLLMKDDPNIRLVISGLLELPEYLSTLGADRIERHPLGDYMQYLETIGRCSINLVPLEDLRFNDAKSELKIFEAALWGVPSIASPSEPNKAAIRHGIDGMLARSYEDWAECLAALCRDQGLRIRLGDEARNRIAPRFSYAAVGELADKAYSEMLEQAGRRTASAESRPAGGLGGG